MTAPELAAALGAAVTATWPPTPPAPKSLNALLHIPAHMELSQIELIYRAEGNANLVLALPQFKKVLRLPKMISSRQSEQQKQQQHSRQQAEPEAKQQQQAEPARQQGQFHVSAPTKASSAKAGDLTMPDFMAYIEIIRRLLGNEFVCQADIVAIPKESDRFWINEHIRAARPISRLDKEFVGQFGLLLPDVTQLPATFDVLLANLQVKSTATMRTITTLGDTYAIEIKPKQGWLLLPSDVSDLFDLRPKEGGEGGQGGAAAGTVTKTAKLTASHCRCRYCSMQLLKLKNHKIKRLGTYCPLELFSGAPGRMLDALDALFACPQNNLRVFRNGNLIYGDHANSISCEELHTQVFRGEIMVLIKHLLVATLLREYGSHVADDNVNLAAATEAASRNVESNPVGEKTKAEAAEVATKSGTGSEEGGGYGNTGNSDGGNSGFVKAVAAAGQPQYSSSATKMEAAEKANQRHTKRIRITAKTSTTTTTEPKQTATTTATATTMSWTKSTNVVAMATRTETKTETEAEATQAQINKAEIFRLPKNCVLQKILNLQLLAKRHLRYMWQTGCAENSASSYKALHSLLAQSELKHLAPEQEYMLGATALDCSIMVTFQEIAHCADKGVKSASESEAGSAQASLSLAMLPNLQPWHVHLDQFKRDFLTKVSVLDLDPKPDSHFHKFIKQTKEIENCSKAFN